MTEAQILQELTGIFRVVFRDPGLSLSPSLAARDVSKWDSIAHLDMLAMVEDRFQIRIPTWKITSVQNVGDLVALIGSLQTIDRDKGQ